MRKLGVVVCLLLLTSSCAGNSDTKNFVELLQLVEEGELPIENSKEKLNDFILPFVENCSPIELATNPIPANCKSAYADLYNALTEINYTLSSNIPELRARLFAVPVSKGNPWITKAKDSFILHMEAWRNYHKEIYKILPSDIKDLTSENLEDFLDSILRSKFTTEINDTFFSLCAELGNAQPSGNDDYKLRIVDICDD